MSLSKLQWDIDDGSIYFANKINVSIVTKFQAFAMRIMNTLGEEGAVVNRK